MRSFRTLLSLAGSLVASAGRRFRGLLHPPSPALRPQPLTARQVERIYPLRLEIETLHRRRRRFTAERRALTTDALRIWQDISGQRVVLLEAYCHMRQAPRRFRCDRIIELRDSRTGQVVSGWKAVVAWLEHEAVLGQEAGARAKAAAPQTMPGD